MNQKSDALRRSEVKKAAAFAHKVSIALIHLPRILECKYYGLLYADNRDILYNMLILDGVLGARRNAKSIAHALKHGLPINEWQRREAHGIVNAAIRQACELQIINEETGEQKGAIELRLVIASTNPILLKDLPHNFHSDHILPDDEYPLSSLPRHQLARLGQEFARE